MKNIKCNWNWVEISKQKRRFWFAIKEIMKNPMRDELCMFHDNTGRALAFEKGRKGVWNGIKIVMK